MNPQRPRHSSPDTSSAKVSVVVPTVGRPELARALKSVRNQDTFATIELIVVNDGGPTVRLPAEVYSLADIVIDTSGRTGGSNARNLGMSASSGDFVAFLDDDDEWLPQKLELQLALALSARDPERILVSGRHIHVDARTGAVSGTAPKRLLRNGETIEHYLFRRRPPHGGRPSLYTSTLLCSRSLAVSEQWDTELRRHQDWDWVIRLGRQRGVQVLQTPQPIVQIQLGTVESVSAGTDWKASLSWANKALRDQPSIYADFIAAQTLRYALQSREWRGVRTVLTALARSKRVPSVGPLVIGGAGMLSRKSIERITAATSTR